MAQRMVRNDFVAGEISPELWGRHDVEMYFHGAAAVENFVPRKTGGVRKRAGTDFLWRGSADGTQEWRCFGFTHDKDCFGFMAMKRAAGSQTVYARFVAHRADGTIDESAETAVPVLSLATSEHLSSIRCVQIGDTLFFTLHGHRAVRAAVTFATPSVEWSQVVPSAKPDPAPGLNAKAVNFRSGSGYTASSRTYRLWGVKDGVLSEYSQTRADITLAWVSGAYIDVTFTPNWAAHDYYILAKLQGGQYGEVSRYYPGRNAGARSDTDWTLDGSQTATIDGVTYTASSADPSADWKTTDTEVEDANGDSSTGYFATALHATYAKAPTAPVLSILLWLGAKTYNGSEHGVETGLGEQVTVKFRQGGSTGEVIASWTLAGQYGDSSHTLVVQSPAAPTAAGSYTITFEDSHGASIHVPVRGAILCSDSATLLFHDDNIQPGTLAGEQTALTVGDTGMDVDIITTWQQRLVAASSNSLPFTMWFSVTGDLYNFHAYRPQNSDDAFEATIASTEANRILHIIAQKWLLVLTESGEHVVGPTDGTMAFNTISVKKTSGVGAHPSIEPTTTEGDVLFVAKDARSVYKMDYSLERDSVVPSELSTRAAHITELHRIKKIAYQRHPDSVLWCLLDDGSLASMTFVPDENVCGWARHTLAGGAGLVVEDIFTTGSIRSDAETDTTSDLCLVLRDAERPGDVWVERARPCVVSDSPAVAAAECKDHMGYAAADYPSGGNPEAQVEARLVTMRLEPQQADMIGKQSNVFDTTLRIRRSGTVATRAEGASSWASSAAQAGAAPTVGETNVALVRKDVKVAPFAFQNRDTRLEIKSADEWPCEILSLLAMVEFGNQKWGG